MSHNRWEKQNYGAKHQGVGIEGKAIFAEDVVVVILA